MAWDFSTDPETQALLDWTDRFVREEVEPLDFIIVNSRDMRDPVRQELIPPLQQRVKDRGLWSMHLPPEWGGRGFGHLRLALLEELVGRSDCAPIVFGCQSPDSGNAQIIARYGTDAQKQEYLQPLLDGEMVSCFSATEPHSGADPTMFTTRGELVGNEWVLNGEKWFASHYEYAAFTIMMVLTDPDADPHRRLSAFFIPAGTPGIEIVRNVGVDTHDGPGIHSYLRLTDVRLPADSLLGERGEAFKVMQTRMGHARLALATRALGQLRRAIEQMTERAVSRTTKGERLADKQLVQEHLAESWLDFETFRLLVLRTAWKLDQAGHDFKAVRADTAAVKMMLPRVLQRIGSRAAQIHGSLGVSSEMPFVRMAARGLTLGVADGPTEVHAVTLARSMVRDVAPAPGVFPTRHLPALRADAIERYRAVLERHGRVTTSPNAR